MKTKQFRIIMFGKSMPSCMDNIVLMAAASNGRDEKLTLEDMQGYFNSCKNLSPTLMESYSVTLVKERFKLLVDYTDYAKQTSCVLEIEEIELFAPFTKDELSTSTISENGDLNNDANDLKDVL